MTIIVMGVSGSGKTTIGTALARDLGWRFVEGDDRHPAANVEKMSRGEALTDANRAPWLDAIRAEIVKTRAAGESLVIACSALKQRYRDRLTAREEDVVFVYLRVPPQVLQRRLAARTGHFAGPKLLASQLATLEEPRTEAIVVDGDQPPERIVAAIRAALRI